MQITAPRDRRLALPPRQILAQPVAYQEHALMDTRLADFIRDTPAGHEAEAILRSCVHCGFCTATCPTYQLLGDELDGQVVSHERQVRQRSRCRRVFSVTGLPSRTCLIR